MNRIFIFFLILMFYTACLTQREEENIPATEVDFPDQESWDATILITKDGNTIGHLRAGHIQKFTGKNLTLMDRNIKVDFYNNFGEHTSVLTSRGGKVFDQNQDMVAYGDVVVVSDSGMTLFTDTLKWDNNKQKIYSEIPIKITTEEGDTLFGDSFISDPSLKNREIINPRGKSSKSITID